MKGLNEPNSIRYVSKLQVTNKTMIDPIKFDMYGAVRFPIPDTLAFSI